MTFTDYQTAVKAINPEATPGRMAWTFEMGFSPEYAADWMAPVYMGDDADEDEEDDEDGEPEDFAKGSRGRLAD